MQRFVLDAHRAAESTHEQRRHCRAEIAQILAEHDRSGRRRDRRDRQLRAGGGDVHELEAAVPEGALRLGRDRPLRRLEVDANHPAVSPDSYPLLAERRGGLLRERQGVHVPQVGLVAAGLDPRREPELVEQLDHLPGRGVDDLDVPRRGVLERLGTDQGLCKAADGRQRRPQIVGGKGDQLRELGLFGHFATVSSG